MKIYLDCEGCVYSMLDAIKRRNPDFKPKNVVNYDFKDCDVGIPLDEVLRYLEDSETFRLEPLYKGAKEGVRQLLSLGEVIGYSTVPSEVTDFRKYQFKKVGVTKTKIFVGEKPYIPDADVVIDDCPDVLKLYDSETTLKIMVNQPYNKFYKDAYRVKNLIEASEIIRKHRK